MLTQHEIITKGTQVVKLRPHRILEAKREAVEVRKMLDDDIIEPSRSP